MISFRQSSLLYDLTIKVLPQSAFGFRLTPKAVEAIGTLREPHKVRQVSALEESLGIQFRPFVLDGNWGFGPGLNSHSIEAGGLMVEVPLRSFEEKGTPCEYCGGSGFDPEWADVSKSGPDWDEDLARCRWCLGRGHDITYKWDEARSVASTIEILLLVLHYMGEERFDSPPADQPPFQIIRVESLVLDGAAPISGEFSRHLVAWLDRRGAGSTFPNVELWMRKVYLGMFPSVGHLYRDNHYFRTYVQESGWLTVDCPGEACGLYPTHFDRERFQDRGQGYQIACHNLDSVFQQLTLLAGLAGINDEARAQGVGL